MDVHEESGAEMKLDSTTLYLLRKWTGIDWTDLQPWREPHYLLTVYCENQLVPHIHDICALCASAKIVPMMFWNVYIFLNSIVGNSITLSNTLNVIVSVIKVFNFRFQYFV